MEDEQRSGRRVINDETVERRILEQLTKAPTQGFARSLAQLYANLTSDAASNAWPAFLAAVEALPNFVANDDPFGGAILAGVAAEKAAHQIVASVRAVLVAAHGGDPASLLLGLGKLGRALIRPSLVNTDMRDESVSLR